MTGKKTGTLSYCCVQASFWMTLCVYMGYAAVYLQSLGYSNTSLGVIMASGTLGGSLLGPVLSSMIDRNTDGRITAHNLTPPVVAAQAVTLVLLLLFPVRGPVTSIAFALFIAVASSVNSLNLKLYTDAGRFGLDIDYGIARSMGSLGYVMTSAIVGLLCERISVRMIPAAGLVLSICQFTAFLSFSRHLNAARGSDSGVGIRVSGDPGIAVSSTIIGFLIRNKRFSMFLAGTVLIFFAHSTMCNFFINIVRNVGGDTSDMGFLNGFMAMTEIPVMFFYSKFTRGRRTDRILKFALIIFTAKAAAVAAAGSVAGIAAALLLQASSFGLYTAAIVIYADMIIPHEDSAKAQSLAFSVTMLGSVFASTIAGRLFDLMPVSSVMWAVCAVSAVGSFVAYLGVQKTKTNN